jgi:CubicO group peptidase (beta-lactamase class C family)
VTVSDRVEEIFGRPPELGVSLAMVVMIDGEVVAERYGVQPATPFGPAAEVTPDTTLISWSTAKSITHAAVGILIGDGVLDPAAPAPVPAWAGTEKSKITLLDLLEMRAGLRFVEDYVDGEVSHCLPMLFGEGAGDMAAYAAGQPLDHEPGTVWNYSSGTTNIICRIIGDALGGRAATGQFLRERLFEPAGMTSATPRFDDAGTWVGSSYVYATARDFARFGELYRNDGVAVTGERLLPAGWADHGRSFVAHDRQGAGRHGFDYGRHWWMWPELPGSIAAHGYEGQYIVVAPDRRATVVHLGKTERTHQPPLVAAIGELIESIEPEATDFGDAGP